MKYAHEFYELLVDIIRVKGHVYHPAEDPVRVLRHTDMCMAKIYEKIVERREAANIRQFYVMLSNGYVQDNQMAWMSCTISTTIIVLTTMSFLRRSTMSCGHPTKSQSNNI